MIKIAIFTKYTSLTILAILGIAFFSYNLPAQYQLANLTKTNKTPATVAGEIMENQGVAYSSPTIPTDMQTGQATFPPTMPNKEITNQFQSLLTNRPGLYQLLNPNSTHHTPLQLGAFILTSQDKFILVPGSISNDFLDRHTIESVNLATGSITSRTIEDKTIRKEDLSNSLKEQIYDTDSDSGVTEETDPIFTAWNKSTGISITESQISDLQSYITDGNTNWNNSYGFITDLTTFTTDNLTQGSTNKYSQWTTNGSNLSYTNNIGIGTTAPGNKLHIYTGDATSGLRTSLICSSSTVSKLLTDASGNLICGTDQTGSGTGNLIDSLADTLAAGNDANATGITNLGNVGIGTTSAGAKLDVFSGTNAPDTSATLGSGIRLSAGSGAKADSYINFWASSTTNPFSYGASRIHSGWDLSASTDWNKSYIAFQTHATDTASWTDDVIIRGGNVGIGTTGPTEKLHIIGNLLASGTLSSSNLSGTNTGDNATNSLYSGLASSKQDALSGTGFVTISGTTISYDNSTYVTGTPWTSMGYLTSYTETDPNVSAWAKAATKPTYTATEVSLGNVTNESKATMFTSPTFTGTVTIPSPFTIGATSVTTTGTQFNYLNAATGTTGTASTNLVFSTAPTLTNPIISNISPGANFTLTQNAVAPFTSVETGAVANTLYLATGNVGIGTTSPLAKLGVFSSTGNQLTIGYDATHYADFLVSATGNLSITPNVSTATTTIGSGADVALKIDSLGNVGIGTTTPGVKFHIYTGDGTSGLRTSLICSNSTTSKLYTDADGNLVCGTDQTGSGTGNIVDSLTATLGAGNDGGALGMTNLGSLGGITTLSMNNQLTSTLAIGTAPFVVTSTTMSTNLNADLLDGNHANAFATLASPTFTGTVTIPSPFTLGATSVTTTGTQFNYLNAATGTTGTASTNLVFSTSPTLTNPVITNISPGANFTLTQNSVAPFTSVEAGAVANTLYLAAGQVGIGTNTPSYALDVAGSAAFGTGAEVMRISSLGFVGIGTTTPGYIFDIQADTKMNSKTGYLTNGADYAEYFYTKDTDLVSGEVVCVDVTKANAVKRCQNSGDNNVMGIVSTNPSIVGNGDGTKRENDKNYKIIGMMGQVPGLVSAENGEIHIGDNLTAASTPGYMRKTNAGESTVGVAMQNFSDEKGTIQILISRRNQSLTVEKVEESVTQNIASLNIQDQVNALLANASLALEDKITSQTTSLSDMQLQLMGVRDDLAKLQGQMTAFNSDLEGSLALEVDRYMQIFGFDNSVVGKLGFTGDLDIFGKISAQDIFASGTVTANDIVTGTLKLEENKTSGKGVILHETTETLIETPDATEDAKIYITPKGSTFGKTLYFDDIVEGVSFKVKIDQPKLLELDQNINFNWLIIK